MESELLPLDDAGHKAAMNPEMLHSPLPHAAMQYAHNTLQQRTRLHSQDTKEARRLPLHLSTKVNYSTQLMLVTLPHSSSFSAIIIFSLNLLLTISIKGKEIKSVVNKHALKKNLTDIQHMQAGRQTDGRTDRQTDFPSLTLVSDARVCFSMG